MALVLCAAVATIMMAAVAVVHVPVIDNGAISDDVPLQAPELPPGLKPPRVPLVGEAETSHHLLGVSGLSVAVALGLKT